MKTLLLCGMICLPLKFLQLNSPFGYRIHPLTGKYVLHAGVDLKARLDTVFAVMDGQAANVGCDTALGIFIQLRKDNVTVSYGHLSQVFINTGEQVTAGRPIAITGATGRVTGEHLHFSVRIGRRYVDPLQFIYNNLINQKNHE